MTKETAVGILRGDTLGTSEETWQAVYMAIEALQEQKTGKWEERRIEDTDPLFRRRYYCSACGDWQTYGPTKYCPTCGAKMVR